MKSKIRIISKKEITLIGLTLGVLVIAFVSGTLKDTHAYYSDKTEISLFNAKVGNFKPVLNSFYIKENNIQPKYTNQNTNIVYLSWGNNNKNINEMCITEGDVNSCRWETINTSTQYTFANNDEGTKIVKGYIKDKAGNKSLEKSDTIIYDKTAPTINKVEATTTTENSITISVTANQDTSGIDKYCYATSQTGPYTCKSENTNQYTGLEGGKEYTFWIYLKDKAGNGVQNNATQYKFKTAGKPAKDYLEEKNEDTFILKNGMYRFVGTSSQVTNNYICFGTTDSTTCKNTPETYIYRIIGITSEDDNIIGLKANQLKIIKATPSSTSQVWHNNNGDTKWDVSDMKTYLNTTFLNDAISKWDNGEIWKGLIASQRWYNADQNNTPGATAEPTNSTTAVSQIGLMYATDYANAGATDTSNWLFIANGWTTNGRYNMEWTMTRYGPNVDYGTQAWSYFPNGPLAPGLLYLQEAVRPVFYLIPNITLTGEGTKDSPFIINR